MKPVKCFTAKSGSGINLQNSQVFLLVLLDEVYAVALKFIGRLLISI